MNTELLLVSRSEARASHPDLARFTNLERRVKQLTALLSPKHPKFSLLPAQNVWLAKMLRKEGENLLNLAQEDINLYAKNRRGWETKLIISRGKIPMLDSQLRRNINDFLKKGGRSKKDLHHFLGVKKQEKIRKKTLRFRLWAKRMEELGKIAKKTNLKHRLTDEMRLAEQRGWFTTFSTLTVKDESYDEVFALESPEFKNYIRRVYRDVGRAMNLNASESDRLKYQFHRYFAVVERGGKNGRLHIHCLHLMKKTPIGAEDPNATGAGTNRSLSIMDSYWPHEGAKPKEHNHIMLRTHAHDAWGKAGYKWPCEVKGDTIQPIPTSTNEQIINYVGKYISKAVDEGKQWKKNTNLPKHFRTRMSRGFGQELIIRAIRRLRPQTIWRMLEAGPARAKHALRNSPSWRRIRHELIRKLGKLGLYTTNTGFRQLKGGWTHEALGEQIERLRCRMTSFGTQPTPSFSNTNGFDRRIGWNSIRTLLARMDTENLCYNKTTIGGAIQ